jgi:hypothetical protein
MAGNMALWQIFFIEKLNSKQIALRLSTSKAIGN